MDEALLYVLESLDNCEEVVGSAVETYPEMNVQYIMDLLSSLKAEIEVLAQKAVESTPEQPQSPSME